MKHKHLLKSILSVMLITLMTVVAISCGDDVEDPVIYTVTVMTAEGGTADASCYEVIAGEEVTLIATAESGYRFKCWMLNGKEVSTQNPYTVVVGKNTVYVAKFVKEGTEDLPSDIEILDILFEIEKDEMVFVKGGSFTMGATSEQIGDAKDDEKPTHLVQLSDYYISRYEVTQKFWETIMGNNPSSTKGDNLPVDNVSWEECQQFIKKLNKRTDKRYSLPTEAEWEYAARGGDKTENYKFSGSNRASEVAWSDAIDGTIEPVGTKKYNELGIYDMSGNVSEWCFDWYTSYTNQTQTNPTGANDGEKRVVRGGNISSSKTECRVSTRNSLHFDSKQQKTGFRLVLSKPTYEVSVKPSSEERGSVTIAGTTNTQYIREGGVVTLTATPNEGYGFVNWTVNGVEVSKANPYTATITADTQFKVNFKAHEYVDLGLSVKWATCNVGATSPEEYGDYFAWGETSTKTGYDWITYKYCNGSWNTMTKYCIISDYGTADSKYTLELIDDAARVNWGGKWRMPTKAEQAELRNTSNCTWTWTTQNGVNGYKVTSKVNGNSIFLPAAGHRAGIYGYIFYAGSRGWYWSSSLSFKNHSADCLYIYSDYVDLDFFTRYFGCSVRAVCE